MKPRITNQGIRSLKCFPNVAYIIGDEEAVNHLRAALINTGWFDDYSDAGSSFCWASTPQGSLFWNCIDDGINPIKPGVLEDDS